MQERTKKRRVSLNVKVAIIMLLFTIFLSVGTVIISYLFYTASFNRHYEDLATSITKTSSSVINAGDVAKVTDEVKKVYRRICAENGGIPDLDGLTEADMEKYYSEYAYIQEMPEYKSLLEILKKIREDNHVVSLYLGYTDVETMRDLYIVDASEDGQACRPGDMDSVEEEHIAKVQSGDYTFPAYVTNYEEYGWLCSASAPVFDEEGNVICMVLVDISMEKIMSDRQSFLIQIAAIIAAVAVVMLVMILLVTDKTLLKPIGKLSTAARNYVGDEKSEKTVFEPLKIKTGDEIEDLYDSLRQMESDIHTYIEEVTAITAEKERIGAELDVARHIQASMLPCIFPAFPERHEFDVYASMTPAKEVGGDFYDFFLVDDDHLAVVMADVSGKGVPAALFMMISKTLIKSAAQSGLSPKAVLEKVNNQLCENNEAEMFVTLWLGILEISTGKMKCANAGHEYPAIMHRGGDFELLKDRHGFVLAGMEGARYREYEIEMKEGDRLFVYTDGVPEATDASNTLYGTDRMLDALNRAKDGSCRRLLESLHGDVDAFVGEADQFDDITMLCLEIKSGAPEMQELTVVPSSDKVTEITEYLENILTKANASPKLISQINIVTDEIFSNIALYSGATEAKIGYAVSESCLTLRFSDNGTPYDPTKNPDPDTTLSADERKIGGLGIFMVKKMMDTVSYEYKDGLNILTIIKNL